MRGGVKRDRRKVVRTRVMFDLFYLWFWFGGITTNNKLWLTLGKPGRVVTARAICTANLSGPRAFGVSSMSERIVLASSIVDLV